MAETKSKTTLIIEPGKQEVVASRYFDAPIEKVFSAHIDPEAIKFWWGPAYLESTIDEFDPTPGGKWKISQREPSGERYGFHGVYHSVEPSQIVRTFEYEGVPGHVLMETTRFEEQDGKTLLTAISVYQTLEDRDGMVAAGMESGALESMDLLAQLVESK